jgi:hypothetical protein
MGDGDHMPEGGIGEFCGRSVCETVLLQCMYFNSGSTIRVLLVVGGTVVDSVAQHPAHGHQIDRSDRANHPPLKKNFPIPKIRNPMFYPNPHLPPDE